MVTTCIKSFTGKDSVTLTGLHYCRLTMTVRRRLCLCPPYLAPHGRLPCSHRMTVLSDLDCHDLDCSWLERKNRTFKFAIIYINGFKLSDHVVLAL